MFNGLNNQLNNIVNAQLQAQQQQAALQAQQDMIDAERSRIRNKYDEPMTWYSLTREVDDLNNLFSNEVQAINNSAPKEITEKAQPHALLSEIFSKVPAHSQYLSEMQDTIPKSSSMAIADNSWNVLKQRHEEFKTSWKKETTAFKQQYKDAIAKLQGGVGDQGDNIPPADQNQNQNLQQQLENALKQMEEMQAAYAQLQNTNQQQQQQLADKDGVIQNLQNSNNQQQTQIGALQTQIGNIQTRLIEKMEEASTNYNKYQAEKHKTELVKVKLSTFIDNHQDIEGQEQLVNMLGDLEHPADNQAA